VKRYRITVLAAVLGALVAFVLLIPSGGNDSDPPECFSFFGYVVPCGSGPEQSHGAGFAGAGALLAALLVAAGSVAGRTEHDRIDFSKSLS
jgi:hypothetical protein